MNRYSKYSLSLAAVSFFLFVGSGSCETRPYWVLFKDRGPVNVERAVAAKAASPSEIKSRSRRARVYGPERVFDETDLPVHPEYIETVAGLSGGIRTVTRFFNGVSADLDDAGLEKVKKLPFVREVKPVAVYVRPKAPESPPAKPSARERTDGYSYGGSFEQLSIVGITKVHEAGYYGEGITVAVLDSGFDGLNHAAFDSIRIVARRDFVDGDDEPSGDDHGTEVLSVLAALDYGRMIGAAPHAAFILARTENVEGDVEQRIEEDYWVAGVEWADSLGADIVNSSLGYTTFDDGTGYTYRDLDGDTAVTTVAADMAAAKGMIVVSSAGNEGNTEWYYITTPADGDSVIAVGSVDLDGSVSAFSSRGPSCDGRVKPDFVALGEDVVVIDASKRDAYRFANGTSFAAPAVSGAVALLLEINPAWDFGDVREALIATAEKAGPDSLYGYGLIDAFAASGLKPPEPGVSAFRVYDPYPQPVAFDGTTRHLYFPVDVPVAGRTLTIRIFSFNGENVKTLEAPVSSAGELREPGDAPSWDGTNFLGEDVAPGVYFYTIQLFGYGKHTGKIMVMR